jgi:hypothetical protein
VVVAAISPPTSARRVMSDANASAKKFHTTDECCSHDGVSASAIRLALVDIMAT